MLVVRWSSSGMIPLRVGSKCWTMTKARPLFFGTRDRKCSKASNPPAEAPMPMIGKESLAGGAGAATRTALAGFFDRRSGLDFVLIIMLSRATVPTYNTLLEKGLTGLQV